MRARNCMGALALGALALGASVYAAPRDGAADVKKQARGDAIRSIAGSDAVHNDAAVRAVAQGCLTFEAIVRQNAGGPDACNITSGGGTSSVTMSGNDCAFEFDVFVSNWNCIDPGPGPAGRIQAWQVRMGADADLPAGISGAPQPACTTDADCAALGYDDPSGCEDVNPPGDFVDDTCVRAWQDTSITPNIAYDIRACNTNTYICGATANASVPVDDDGVSKYYGATMRMYVDPGASGTIVVPMLGIPDDTFVIMGNGPTFGPEKAIGPEITIPTGRCCEAAGCVEDVTLEQCSNANLWTVNGICPQNGGPDCAECLSANDPACNDGDACTVDSCNVALGLCVNTESPPIAAGTCCNPANNARAGLDDGDPCTDDTCSLGGNRGVPEHDPAADGSACDDANPCTGFDECVGGVCAGTNVNGQLCAVDAECQAGGTPGAVCDNGRCSCSLAVNVSFGLSGDEGKPKSEEGLCVGGENAGNLCADDADCPDTAAGAPGVCTAGFFCDGGSRDGLFCQNSDQCPGTLAENGYCQRDACYPVDSKVVATIELGASAVELTGGQFYIQYDPSCLDFNSIMPTGVWPMEIQEQVDEVAGTIFWAAGVGLGQPGTFGNVSVGTISFNKLGGCSDCSLCYISNNPLNTRLTDFEGQSVEVEAKCSNVIRQSPSIALDLPESVKVNVACNSNTREVTWDAPTASSDCEDVVLTCQGLHLASDMDMTDMAMGGGVFPVGNTNFCCSAGNSCGNGAEGCWTVTVNDETCLDVEIQLSPTMKTKPGGGITRCIKFEVFSNCVQPPLVFEEDMVFGGLFNLIGHFNGNIKIPSATQPVCITARDQLHTLRGCYLLAGDGSDCREDGCIEAVFKGDPFFGGNWLIGGNLDGWKKDNPNASHDVIDILDFGQLVAQWLADYGSGDTPCGTEGPNADINGDGVVDLLDFSFVSMNFLEDSKDCCCPGSASLGNTEGRTSVPVAELKRNGMGDLSVADLNADGVVDMADMQALLQGVRPQRQAPERDGKGAGTLRSFNR